MITTLITEPEQLGPVETGLFFVANSDWSSVEDFKFIWKLWEVEKNNNLVATYDLGVYVTPPDDAYQGVWSSHKILKSRIKYVYEPCISNNSVITFDDWVPYQVQQGFDTSLELRYYDTLSYPNLGLTFSYPHHLTQSMVVEMRTSDPLNANWDGMTASIVTVGNNYFVTDKPFGNSGPAYGGIIKIPFDNCFNSNGYLGIEFPGRHIFQSGDYITLNKDDKTWNSDYDGEFLVLSTSTYSLVVDHYWGTTYSFGQESGYVDRMARLENASNIRYAFRAGRQYTEQSFTFSQFINLEPLTDFQGYKEVPIGQWESMRYFLSPSNWPTYVVKRYYNNGTTTTNTYSTSITRDPLIMMHLACGTLNLTNMFGPGYLDGVDKYEVYLSSIPIS